jgi:hypothetical protein
MSSMESSVEWSQSKKGIVIEFEDSPVETSKRKREKIMRYNKQHPRTEDNFKVGNVLLGYQKKREKSRRNI